MLHRKESNVVLGVMRFALGTIIFLLAGALACHQKEEASGSEKNIKLRHLIVRGAEGVKEAQGVATYKVHTSPNELRRDLEGLNEKAGWRKQTSDQLNPGQDVVRLNQWVEVDGVVEGKPLRVHQSQWMNEQGDLLSVVLSYSGGNDENAPCDAYVALDLVSWNELKAMHAEIQTASDNVLEQGKVLIIAYPDSVVALRLISAKFSEFAPLAGGGIVSEDMKIKWWLCHADKKMEEGVCNVTKKYREKVVGGQSSAFPQTQLEPESSSYEVKAGGYKIALNDMNMIVASGGGLIKAIAADQFDPKELCQYRDATSSSTLNHHGR